MMGTRGCACKPILGVLPIIFAASLDVMKPSNPVEGMLAIQVIWNHRRVAHRPCLAAQKTNLDTL